MNDREPPIVCTVDWENAPKADPHVHLEGTVTSELLETLSAQLGVDPWSPVRLADGREFHPVPDPFAADTPRQRFRNFVGTYLKITEVLRHERALAAAIQTFAGQCAAQSVRRADIYFTPNSYRLLGAELGGLYDVIKAASGVAKDVQRVELRWIFDIVRGLPDTARWTLEQIQRAASAGVNVFALGLAGYENEIDAALFCETFEQARAAGLITIAHGGEGTSAEHVRQILVKLRPDRIGHGISVLEDERLVDECRTSGIVFEVCPWSNVLLGHCVEREHPLKSMIDAGLHVVIGSDDPGIFRRDLLANYELGRLLGLSDETLGGAAARSLSL